MGTFQASVGLWQILARQGQIDRSYLNSSWQDVIKPFGRFTTPAQLVTAGRNSVAEVFRAASGKQSISQDEIITVLSGYASNDRRRSEGATGNGEPNAVRAVLDDQRLVSLDTLFALDDGLNKFRARGTEKGNVDRARR